MTRNRRSPRAHVSPREVAPHVRLPRPIGIPYHVGKQGSRAAGVRPGWNRGHVKAGGLSLGEGVSMRQRLLKASLALTALVLMPSLALAQSSIVGTVRDASGAVLPGVTVEASSPALIERTRTVVTNGVGQYSIQDLRPGTYAVTFALPGFSTIKRDGIELAGTFIATVNADLRVGGGAE